MPKLLIMILLSTFIVIGCSETKDPLSSVAHENGWTNPESQLFHANKVRTIGAVSCRACHGEQVDKGVEGSFCIACHKDYPDVSYPHGGDWTEFDNPNSHGQFIQNHANNLTCNYCHSGDQAIAISCDSCH